MAINLEPLVEALTKLKAHVQERKEEPMSKKLWKTTVVIWTEFDPSQHELVDLAQEATDGTAYCSYQSEELVDEPLKDRHAPSAEFFRLEEED